MGERPETLSQAFDSRARKHGARVFLREKREKAWVDHSWEAVARAAAGLRAGLIRAGLRPSERLAILSDNGPEWVIVDQAALGAGAVVVPLYTTSNVEETAHVLRDSGARLVAAKGEQAVRRVMALAASLPELRGVIAMHPEAAPASPSDGALAVMTLADVSRERPAPVLAGSRADLATIIYTSGTTGASKGVMLTHGNILANVESCLSALTIDESDVILSFMPVAHAFERTAGYYTVMYGGGTIAYAGGLAQIAQNILEIEPTLMLTVPRLLEVIYMRIIRAVEASSPLRRRLFAAAVATGKRAARYRHRGLLVPNHLALPMALFRGLVFRRIRAVFGPRLRYIISGGAPLPTQIFELLAAAEVPIVEGYGLTEAAPVVCTNLHGRTKIGTVGPALPGIEARTAEDGELLLRGANVMKGYYGREQDTREAIDAEGWLHTGDIARIDPDGFITITDRKKEIIVLSGGKNVSPAGLETRLAADPYIAQACVVGDRRKHLAALLVPNFENLKQHPDFAALAAGKPAQAVDDPRLRAFYQERIRRLNRSLSDVEAISAFSLLAEPFSQENGELTPTMKVRRKAVQAHYHERIDELYRD